MRSELTDELFDKIIDELQNSDTNLTTVLDKNDVSTYMFYKTVNSSDVKAKRYVHARSIYVENTLNQRRKIMEDAVEDAKHNPKCASAIVNAAREICRQLEYNCEKLIPHKYGNKIDVTSNGETVNKIEVELLSKANVTTDK